MVEEVVKTLLVPLVIIFIAYLAEREKIRWALFVTICLFVIYILVLIPDWYAVFGAVSFVAICILGIFYLKERKKVN